LLKQSPFGLLMPPVNLPLVLKLDELEQILVLFDLLELLVEPDDIWQLLTVRQVLFFLGSLFLYLLLYLGTSTDA